MVVELDRKQVEERFNVVITNHNGHFFADIPELGNTYGYSNESADKAIEDLVDYMNIFAKMEAKKQVIDGISDYIKTIKKPFNE